jgi:hypothetical protein
MEIFGMVIALFILGGLLAFLDRDYDIPKFRIVTNGHYFYVQSKKSLFSIWVQSEPWGKESLEQAKNRLQYEKECARMNSRKLRVVESTPLEKVLKR